MPRPGEVVIVRFPFSDQRTFKRRPALVIADAHDGDILLARITTALVNESTDLFVTDWQSAGLIRPSWVRLAKLAIIRETDIGQTIGTFANQDAINARRALVGWLAEAWPEPQPGSA
ncbi:MAG: type II toxin-antitoxin system PemK/MazF family toxin [bacterium]